MLVRKKRPEGDTKTALSILVAVGSSRVPVRCLTRRVLEKGLDSKALACGEGQSLPVAGPGPGLINHPTVAVVR